LFLEWPFHDIILEASWSLFGNVSNSLHDGAILWLLICAAYVFKLVAAAR
jgi:hypothetical protein